MFPLDKNLVGGVNPSEKYESQSGGLIPIYGKIKVMFQTTNLEIHHLLSSLAPGLIRDVLELRRLGATGIKSSKKDTLLLEDLGKQCWDQ